MGAISNQQESATAETQDSTHCFRFSVRHFAHQSEHVSKPQEEGVVTTFQQDKDALEAIAERRKNDPRKVFAEASFASDRPGLETRRLLLQATEASANDCRDNQGNGT